MLYFAALNQKQELNTVSPATLKQAKQMVNEIELGVQEIKMVSSYPPG